MKAAFLPVSFSLAITSGLNQIIAFGSGYP
jgi:hypothetical protein